MSTVPIAIVLVSMLWACRHPEAVSPADDNDRSSVIKFLRVLHSGGRLWGLRSGCDEWRATPDPKAESECSGSSCVSGQLESETESGKIYGFSYETSSQGPRTTINLLGRGSWHPAPGFVFANEAPDTPPGYVTIGTGVTLMLITRPPAPACAAAVA